MKGGWFIFAMACILFQPAIARNGLSYADNQVFPHGYVDFDRAGPLHLPDYPFASFGNGVAFQTSYRSLYHIKELTDNRAGFAFSRHTISAGAAVATFGEPDYFHQLGLAGFVSYRWKDIAFGGALIYSRLSFNEKYDYLSAVTINIGGAYTRGGMTAFFVSRAVNQPQYYARSRHIMPEIEIGTAYKSSKDLGSQAKALFIRHQKPTAELSQSLRLSDYARINWALVLLPARFGGGLRLEKGHFICEYKLSHHPVLGMTHTVELMVYKN